MLNVDHRSSLSTLAALLLPAMLTLVACGGGGGATPGNAGTTGSAGVGNGGTTGTQTGGTTGTPTAGTGGMSATGGTTGTPTGGTMGGTAAQCDTYCTNITANCTGPKAQYADKANCLKVCSKLPAGTATDATGNTVGCRNNAAKTAAANPMGCWAAGPMGFGTCGSECDIFCGVATTYCSAAGGYAGAALYASVDECLTDCGGWGHEVDPAKPGIYSANYTPGTAADNTIDTSDCRAYHLFVNAFGSAAGAQAMHCPHAANKSAPCGPGYTPAVITQMDGGESDGPVSTGVTDGGYVNIINSTTWTETKYPPAMRKMLLRDEGDPHVVMIDLSKTPIMQWKTVAGGGWARAAQLIGNNQILGGRADGYEVFDYTSGTIVKSVKSFGNTQSAYRLANGETMLTTSGTVLKFLDKNDALSHQISYPGYGYVRVARPTRNGTFLVPADQTVFEGDSKGNVLWKASGGAGWGHIWEPLLLGPPVGGGKWNDGDTLLCNAFGKSCDVIDKVTHKVGFRFGITVPVPATVRPNFFSEFEILPNGNIFCSNWQGHGTGNGGNGLQVLEFDPTGALVWFWKQDPTIFSSIQGVQVMDGKDPKYLHVQETSNNSTWQPVIPTP